MIKVPDKYKGHGLHVYCMRKGCKKTVTNNEANCNRNNVLAKNCSYKDSHVFQSRIWNNITKRTDCIRSYKERNFNAVWNLHQAYIQELKDNNYYIITEVAQKSKPILLVECAAMYIDYLNDIDCADYELKKLTKRHIDAQTRYIKAFLKVLKDNQVNISKLAIGAIHKEHIGFFHSTLLDYAPKTYNHYIEGLTHFFEYIIKKIGHEIDNPFNAIVKKRVIKKVDIVEEVEFEKLIKVISYNNGWDEKKQGKDRRILKFNHYKPYWKELFYAALLTGERADGIVLLKWSNIDTNYINIPNHKVNRLKNSKEYVSKTPITTDLAKLLEKLGFMKNMGSESFVFASEVVNRELLKLHMSRAFTHFWKAAGNRQGITFKHLRKAYITRLTIMLGDKSIGIKHSGATMIREHYLKQEEITKELLGQSMFKIDEEVLSKVLS